MTRVDEGNQTPLDGISAPILRDERAVVDGVVASGPPRGRQRWWLEIPVAVTFYWCYAGIRDLHGNATKNSVELARRHGYDVLHLERLLHLDVEHGVQAVVLHVRPLVVAMDVFYGTMHFLLTAGVFFWLLFRASPQVYRRARNVLSIGTAVALVGFAVFPTMPPRLMPPGVNTVDTLAAVGGLWSYNNGVLEHISDPFAAMPSLHLMWALWVAYALTQRMQHTRWRWAFWSYPAVTSFVIVAAGTHWVLDLAGGMVVFALAVAGARKVDRWSIRLRRSETAARRAAAADR